MKSSFVPRTRDITCATLLSSPTTYVALRLLVWSRRRFVHKDLCPMRADSVHGKRQLCTYSFLGVNRALATLHNRPAVLMGAVPIFLFRSLLPGVLFELLALSRFLASVNLLTVNYLLSPRVASPNRRAPRYSPFAHGLQFARSLTRANARLL